MHTDFLFTNLYIISKSCQRSVVIFYLYLYQGPVRRISGLHFYYLRYYSFLFLWPFKSSSFLASPTGCLKPALRQPCVCLPSFSHVIRYLVIPSYYWSSQRMPSFWISLLYIFLLHIFLMIETLSPQLE